GFIQLIPWYTLAVVAAALLLVVAFPGPAVLRLVRALMVAAAVSAFFGVYEHVRENYRAGPLDFRYTDRWPTMSTASQVWAAVSKAVGPAPTLAPLVLAQAAVLLFCAPLCHPSLSGSSRRLSNVRSERRVQRT